MTPERWRRINDLFDEALRRGSSEREAWLHLECAGDEALYREVARLLDHHERVGRDDFLSPLPAWGAEDSRISHDSRDPWRSGGAETVDWSAPAPSMADERGFTPKAAIARSGQLLSTEARSVERGRLTALAAIDLFIAGIIVFLRHYVLKHQDVAIDALNVAVMLLLSGVFFLLVGRKHFTIRQLKSLELAMIVVFASFLAFTQYRMMRDDAANHDVVAATLVMKNTVQITSILLLTYGIFAPRAGWKEVALVLFPLALMPFATLFVLHAQRTGTMAWLFEPWSTSGSAPILFFGLDAMLLLILAAGSCYGVDVNSRLREQVAAAKQVGQYRLGRKIGSGGMGEVYLAEHQLLKRPCALKLIRPEFLTDPRAVERFEREVRITATLSCRNIIEVFDYGRTEDGSYFYVMEYLPSLTLADLVARHGPLSPGRAVHLLCQICQALRQAHAAGLIHRDIKPANILVTRVGIHHDVAKLLDFGLVRSVVGNDDPKLTRDGGIVGTPAFMSPEQAQSSAEIDERSDIYALGAVAYFLLTGRPPFNGGDTLSVLLALTSEPVLPPSQRQLGIPDDLEAIVLKCLAKHPRDRFQDAEDIETALLSCECAGTWRPEQAQRWWAEFQPTRDARLEVTAV